MGASKSLHSTGFALPGLLFLEPGGAFFCGARNRPAGSPADGVLGGRLLRFRPLVPILAMAREDELAELIALANERGIAVEINGGPVRLEDYCQATAPFYALAHEMGARFTVTADAHHPDDLERLDLALAWARALGLRDRDLLTYQDLTGLSKSVGSP